MPDNPTTRRPPQAARLKPMIMLLAAPIAVAMAIAVVTGMLILNLRDHAMRQADHEQRSLSLILAHQAERSFEAVELVQTAILERLARDGVRSPEAFRTLTAALFTAMLIAIPRPRGASEQR